MPTLAQMLAASDNDHTDLTAAFTARTGLGWHDPTPAAMAAGTALSVVIPAHNNAYSLPVVLDALAKQDTSGTVQVIVIDDASTDDTPAIIRLHPAVDTAYRLPVQVGGAAARNVGTHLADADTIVHLDADMVLTAHALADIAVRAHPSLVQVGFRHNIAYQPGRYLRAEVPEGEPDLHADHRVRWTPPVGKPMFYTGDVYHQPMDLRPLDDTHDFVDLGHGARYFDWDLPRMVVTALVAMPRAAVTHVGGFDPGWTVAGWGAEDTHLGATLIAAGCKITPLRQLRAWHIDAPDAAIQWRAKLASVPARIAYYRHLLGEPAPAQREADLASRAQALLAHAEVLR
ncbi:MULTISPECIES: glycosyltransferase family 2 protein [unclassified Micromonospora]|uniref:glycosyltransferase family 2 protein n=1 Tax=unclassified Micromonospora TaxID=2617518 RepID=UPI003A8A3ECD